MARTPRILSPRPTCIEGAIKGLAGNQLATFTNTSNLLAKATKSDAETMGEYVGTHLQPVQKSQADAMGKGAVGGKTRRANRAGCAVVPHQTAPQMKDAFKEAGAIATTFGRRPCRTDGGDRHAEQHHGGRRRRRDATKSFFENIGAASEKFGHASSPISRAKLLPMMDDPGASCEGKFGDLTSADQPAPS
jgi:hypothetical protein